MAKASGITGGLSKRGQTWGGYAPASAIGRNEKARIVTDRVRGKFGISLPETLTLSDVQQGNAVVRALQKQELLLKQQLKNANAAAKAVVSMEGSRAENIKQMAKALKDTDKSLAASMVTGVKHRNDISLLAANTNGQIKLSGAEHSGNMANLSASFAEKYRQILANNSQAAQEIKSAGQEADVNRQAAYKERISASKARRAEATIARSRRRGLLSAIAR